MARCKVLPTIEALYDSDGITFTCDDEPIEDLELGWQDLDDAELVAEVAAELTEYIDAEDLVGVDNPVETVRRALLRLGRSKVAQQDHDDDEFDDEHEYDDYED